jgi:hypothetical protein
MTQFLCSQARILAGWRLGTETTLLHSLLDLRLPSNKTPSILSQPALDSRYIVSGRSPPKTVFPKNSSIVIDVSLPRRSIETAVLLLRACSFLQEPVYKVVA